MKFDGRFIKKRKLNLKKLKINEIIYKYNY